MGKSWKSWAMIVLLIIAWFGTLDYRYLITPDEGRYAEIAREMAQTGDWITPRLNGLKYFEKPALQYWISALFFNYLGLSEWVARLWPALTGFLSAVFIGFVATKIWETKEVGKIAMLVLISCLWWIGNGHFLSLDMGMSAFLGLGLGSFLLAHRPHLDQRKNCFWMLMAWGATGLATLSKGLIGLFIPAATLILYSLWQRNWSLWTKLHLGKGILLFLLITLPWFILVSLKNPNFAYFFFIKEHFLRYATEESRRLGPIYYFIPILIVGLLPWTSFFIHSIKKICYKKSNIFNPEQFLLVWILFIFIFFSLSNSKLPSYILPIFPAAALLIARVLCVIPNRALQWHTLILWGMAAILITSGGFIQTLPASTIRQTANQSFATFLFAGGCVAIACAAGASWATKQRKKWPALLCFGAMGLVAAQIPMIGHRVYALEQSGYFLSKKIKPYLHKNTPLYIVGFYDQTLPFYLERTLKLVEYHDEFSMGLAIEPEKGLSLQQFIERWQQQQGAMAIMRLSQYQRLLSCGITMKVLILTEDNTVVVSNS